MRCPCLCTSSRPVAIDLRPFSDRPRTAPPPPPAFLLIRQSQFAAKTKSNKLILLIINQQY